MIEMHGDASVVIEYCAQNRLHVAASESLTGGLLANAFVSVPGASRVFLGSAVTYDIHAKAKILGVDADFLKSHGAVNASVAKLMAIGTARLYSGSGWDYKNKSCEKDLQDSNFPVIGLSTTGVAGPGPDYDGKPAGLAYIGIFLPKSVMLSVFLDSESLNNSFNKKILHIKSIENYSNLDVCESASGTFISCELQNSGSREEVRNSVVQKLIKLLYLLLCKDCESVA